MNASLSSLSDRELLTETRRLAGTERQTTAALVALLAEVDARRLYLGGTRALHLSEQAGYGRITAARAARRFPTILARLGEGAISLTTVGLLAPHLTDDNHEAVLDAARHQSKRDVERLVAAMQPQPDIPSSIRALPATTPAPLVWARPIGSPDRAGSAFNGTRALEGQDASPKLSMHGASASAPMMPIQAAASSLALASARRSVVAPIAPLRYLVRITVSEATHRKLERARDLLRHQIPDGDLAAIVDRALTVLLEQAERTKFAATARPAPIRSSRPAPTGVSRPVNGGAQVQSAQSQWPQSQWPQVQSPQRQSRGRSKRSRRIPAGVRRAVWARDEGHCAFVGIDGRCGETGFLEFHHVVPFAAGGPSTVANLQLRCRAHNAHEAARAGIAWPRHPPGPAPRSNCSASTRSGPS